MGRWLVTLPFLCPDGKSHDSQVGREIWGFWTRSTLTHSPHSLSLHSDETDTHRATSKRNPPKTE